MSRKKEMNSSELRQFMIDRQVSAMKQFGYPSVTKDNILTDEVYSMFFKKDLKEVVTELQGTPAARVAQEIISEIDSKRERAKGGKK